MDDPKPRSSIAAGSSRLEWVTLVFDRVIINNGQIRPFLRFLISVVGILTIATVVGFIVVMMPPFKFWSHPVALLFWSNVLTLPLLLGLYWFLTRVLEMRPLGSVGLAFCGRWKNELALGLVAGAGMMVAVAVLERLLGVATFSRGPSSPGITALAGVFFFFLLAVAAVDEELVFRGYPFQRLVDSGGPIAAVIALSVLFGVAHLANPFHNWISTTNTILVGVLLAVCYLRTRSLWLPVGIHFAWNYFQGYVLGLPVSGLTLPEPVLAARVHGHVWLTGGAYGPEGSILTSGIILVGIAYFLQTRRIFITPEMRELVFGPGSAESRQLSIAPPPVVPAGKS